MNSVIYYLSHMDVERMMWRGLEKLNMVLGNMMKAVVFVVGCLLATAVTAASVVNNLPVDYVRVDKDGRGFVRFSGQLINPSDCINETNGNFLSALAFDTTTDGGRAIMSLVLTAKASGKLVYAKGTGGCTIYGNTLEDWSFGTIR